MFKLYLREMIFITPKAVVTMLTKSPDTKFVDYQADSYFDVGVKIVSWGVTKAPVAPKVINLDGSISTNVNLYEKTEKPLMEKFNLLKSTPDNERMFKRQDCNGGSLEVIKNISQGTKDYCQKYVIPDGRLIMAISTSKSLKEENIIIGHQHFGSLYVQIDITDYTPPEVQAVKDFLLSEPFKEYCKTFKETYNTGFNNVLIYMPRYEKLKL